MYRSGNRGPEFLKGIFILRDHLKRCFTEQALNQAIIITESVFKFNFHFPGQGERQFYCIQCTGMSMKRHTAPKNLIVDGVGEEIGVKLIAREVLVKNTLCVGDAIKCQIATFIGEGDTCKRRIGSIVPDLLDKAIIQRILFRLSQLTPGLFTIISGQYAQIIPRSRYTR